MYVCMYVCLFILDIYSKSTIRLLFLFIFYFEFIYCLLISSCQSVLASVKVKEKALTCRIRVHL